MFATTQRTRRGTPRRVGCVLLSIAACVAALAPVTEAGATDTICVALVVDFTPLNGSVDSGCTTVPKGATGYDVLRAGGHTYQICDNGIIGTIDGQPANGCQIKDNNHFWGYWHRKPGSRQWTFSSYGAGYYHPVEGSTDGWVWEDGTTSPPADVAYPPGCHTARPSPTPTAAHAAASQPPRARTASHPTPSENADMPARATPSASVSTGASKQRARRRTAAHHPSTSPSAGVAPTPSTAATTVPPVATTEPSTSSHGQAGPAIGAVAAAALLGAGAWWRMRRRGGA
jgi:hypothetical protein